MRDGGATGAVVSCHDPEVIGVQSVEKREKGMRANKGSNRTPGPKVRHKLEGASNLVSSGTKQGFPKHNFLCQWVSESISGPGSF